MTSEEREFLKRFYQAVADRPLDPSTAADRDAYVPLYEQLDLEDPVRQLSRSIEFSLSDSSALLFSGFNGTGKTTELHRFQREMEQAGYLVLFFDIFEYLTPAAPVEVSDFLMAVTGGMSDALEAAGLLQERRLQSYWERLSNFLKTEVVFEEITGHLGPVDVKASLKSDETFRRRLQQAAAGNLARLVDDVCNYINETIEQIDPDARPNGTVLIVDSIEKFSGRLSTLTAAGGAAGDGVQESIARLFTSHARQLRLPRLHVVYTVPPWLNILSPNVAASYSAGLHILRPIKVREHAPERAPIAPALDALHRVVSQRESEWERLLGNRETLNQISLASGGHIRDLLRLITEIITRTESLPIDQRTLDRAMTQVRGEFVVADDEATWLAEIARTGNCLPSVEVLPRLTTFLDSHLVLGYANGQGWYDIHPLVRDDVLRQAGEVTPAPE